MLYLQKRDIEHLRLVPHKTLPFDCITFNLYSKQHRVERIANSAERYNLFL
jgi:hypothetical protein